MSRSPIVRMAPWLLAGAMAVAVGGCGTALDQDQARIAAERFYAAADRHDGRAACAQLSPVLREQLVADESEPTCARAVLELSLHGSRARAVRVYAASAQVDLVGGDTVFLGDTKLGWRIEAVGCRPAGAGPYDCEAES